MRVRQSVDLHPEVRLILEPIEPKPHERRREAEQRTRSTLLESLYGSAVVYAYRPDGSPCLMGEPSLSISLSHSESYLAFASCSTFAVGVDVEDLGEQVGRVAQRFCTAEEERLGHRAGIPQLLFLHLLWSAKESAYKLSATKPASLHAFRLHSVEALGAMRFILRLEEADSADIISVSALSTETFVLTLAHYELDDGGGSIGR